MFIEGVNYAYYSNWLYTQQQSPPISPYHDGRMLSPMSSKWPINYSHSYIDPRQQQPSFSSFTGVGNGFPAASYSATPPFAPAYGSQQPPYSMQPTRTLSSQPNVTTMQYSHSTPIQNSATLPRTQFSMPPYPSVLPATPTNNIHYSQSPTIQMTRPSPQFSMSPSVVPQSMLLMAPLHQQQQTTDCSVTTPQILTTSKEFVISQISNSEQKTSSVDRLA